MIKYKYKDLLFGTIANNWAVAIPSSCGIGGRRSAKAAPPGERDFKAFWVMRIDPVASLCKTISLSI